MVRRVSWVNPEEIVGGPGGLRAPGRSIKLKIKGYPKEKEEAKSKKYILASRGGKRAQKNPNNPKSWGAEQKDPILPQ